MEKFNLNYNKLDDEFNKPKTFKYADVKDRLVRVAFDVVRFMDADEDIDGLWQIQQTDNGDVIVATYIDSTTEKVSRASVSNHWEALANMKNDICVFYKQEQVRKMASSDFDVLVSEIPLLCKEISEKLNIDKEAAKTFISELPATEKTALVKRFPELVK